MGTVAIGSIIIGIMIFILMDVRKTNLASKKRVEKADLERELSDTKNQLEDVDLREDLVDAKVKLKQRNTEVDSKAEKLDK